MRRGLTFWRNDLRAQYALDRLLAECRVRGITGRCLDLGCGQGDYFRQLVASGRFATVHGLDSNPALANDIGPGFISGRMEDFSADEPYDVIWCSHVLEHTPNPGQFLQRLHVLLRDGGPLCISVPPMKQAITVGHTILWTPGFLLLNLVKAGYDCSDIHMKRKGYNIAALLRYWFIICARGLRPLIRMRPPVAAPICRLASSGTIDPGTIRVIFAR